MINITLRNTVYVVSKANNINTNWGIRELREGVVKGNLLHGPPALSGDCGVCGTGFRTLLFKP